MLTFKYTMCTTSKMDNTFVNMQGQEIQELAENRLDNNTDNEKRSNEKEGTKFSPKINQPKFQESQKIIKLPS